MVHSPPISCAIVQTAVVPNVPSVPKQNPADYLIPRLLSLALIWSSEYFPVAFSFE